MGLPSERVDRASECVDRASHWSVASDCPDLASGVRDDDLTSDRESVRGDLAPVEERGDLALEALLSVTSRGMRALKLRIATPDLSALRVS